MIDLAYLIRLFFCKMLQVFIMVSSIFVQVKSGKHFLNLLLSKLAFVNAVNAVSLVINGSLSVTSTTAISGSLLTGSSNVFITSDGSTEVIQGNISTTQIWNRVLTAGEVSQNFDALRGRFGI